MTDEKLCLLLRDPQQESSFGSLSLGSLDRDDNPKVQEKVSDEPPTLRHSGSPNEISQGWGVLYPANPLGRKLFSAIEELWDWRDKQLRDTSPILRAHRWEIGYGQSARAFLASEYLRLARYKQPLYILILGDFDWIGLDFERTLSDQALVGRLCLQKVEDYRAYAKKIVRCEGAERTEKTRSTPRILLYSPGGGEGWAGDEAIECSDEQMIKPIHQHLVDYSVGRWQLDRDGIFRCGPRSQRDNQKTWADAVKLATANEPTVLISVSHGAGSEHFDAETQRKEQGRMYDEERDLISLDDLSERPFLPQGAWFYNACFGAGTPKESLFEPWLRRMRAAKLFRAGADVAATQARGEHGFVARQPKLALANPEGPLVVYAHADIAFTYSFAQGGGQAAHGEGSAPTAISELADELIQGSRAGVALNMFADPIHAASHEVQKAYQRLAMRSSEVVNRLVDDRDLTALPPELRGRVAKAVAERLTVGGREAITVQGVALSAGVHTSLLLTAYGGDESREQFTLRNQNWMAFHDLKSWILLGDPAARLPIRKNLKRRRITASEFFGYEISSRRVPSEKQTTEPAPAPPAAADAPAGLEVPAHLSAALGDDDEMLAAIRGFRAARTRGETGRSVARDYGVTLEALKNWDAFVDRLIRWSLSRVRARE